MMALFLRVVWLLVATIVLALGWLLGSPVMGILSDRWGSRRLPLMIGSVGGGAAMCVLLWPAMLGYEGLLVFMFIAGLFTSTQVICFAASMEVAPKPLRGTATACCNFITMMVAAVLQIWIGWVLTAEVKSPSHHAAHPAVMARGAVCAEVGRGALPTMLSF